MKKRKNNNGAAKYRAKKYAAPKGSTRAKLLERASKLYKQGKIKQASAIREQMEEKERAKKSFKAKKSPYSKRKRSNGNAKKKSSKK